MGVMATSTSGMARSRPPAGRQQEAVAWPARAGAIAGEHCIGSWSTHLSGIELANMLEVADLAARTTAQLRGQRSEGTLALRSGWVGGLLFRPCASRRFERQQLTGASSMIATARMPQTRVAHLVQPFRQHVLQEAAHELVAVEVRRVPPPRFAMLAADDNAVVVEPDDAAFGDGDAEHISRKIAQDGFGTVAPGRAMDDPGLSPCRLGQHEVGPALDQRSSHFGSHQNRERLCRHQELAACRMPVASIIGDAATGDEAMHMRVVDELLGPG